MGLLQTYLAVQNLKPRFNRSILPKVTAASLTSFLLTLVDKKIVKINSLKSWFTISIFTGVTA